MNIELLDIPAGSESGGIQLPGLPRIAVMLREDVLQVDANRRRQKLHRHVRADLPSTDLKVRSGQSLYRATVETCGPGGIGRRIGLKPRNLSARRETGGAELLKFGEPCNMAIPSQARPETAGKV